MPSSRIMRDCIFGVWHSSETLMLFEYLDGQRKAGKRITLTGFDVQQSGRADGEARARLKAVVETLDPALVAKIDADDPEPLTQASTFLAAQRADDFAVQALKSRATWARMKKAGLGKEGGMIRDEGMADNLDFLLDKRYPGRKVIVWAHNFHIAKETLGESAPQAMGAWIAKRRKPGEVYTVGLYMGRGIAATNARELYAIEPHVKDSLEAVLAGAGRAMAFVDFSRARPEAGNDWMFGPITAREWGTRPFSMVPAKTFDGVLFIDRVTPPEHL
jgi:erythromycin esterase